LDLTLYESWDRIITVGSLPLTLIGLAITIYQITKARSAAEAARDSARKAVADARRGTLLVLLPQLHRVEEQLDRAVRDNSIDLAVAALTSWRWQAGQVRGHLGTTDGVQSLIDALDSSNEICARVKGRLTEANTGGEVAKLTRSARNKISEVNSAIGGVIADSALPGANGGESNG
jgi:hypothetical protein